MKEVRKLKQEILELYFTQKFKQNLDDLILMEMHNQAALELSKNSKLSDMAYRDWNTSAYAYNKNKKRFEFRDELGRSYAVKKYLKGII